MKYLTFQPGFDVYHTEFRMLRFLQYVDGKIMNVDQVRILDFYLLYFFRLSVVRLQRSHSGIKRLAKTMDVPRYQIQPDDRVLFLRMSPIQSAAIQSLSRNGYLSSESFEVGEIKRTNKALPEDLDSRIRLINQEESEILEALKTLMLEYPLLGEGGLKERTGLMEYRYDSI